MKKIIKKNGFTLVEILIATGIFSVFLVAVFGFYSMGSKMFTSGSWRQNTQKQAEMLFAKIRERASRTCAPVKVNDNGTFSEIKAYFGATNTKITSATVLPKRILCFPVSGVSLKGKQGIVMYHILRAVKSTTNSSLFNLEFLTTKNLNMGKGLTFSEGLKYNWFDSTFEDKWFKGNAKDFNLAPDAENVTVLKDVSEISFEIKKNIVNMRFTFNDPKNIKTVLVLTTSVSCDEEVLMDVRGDL